MKFFRVKPAKERKVVFLRKRWLAIPGALLCICALCLVTTLPSVIRLHHRAAAPHLLRPAGLQDLRPLF